MKKFKIVDIRKLKVVGEYPEEHRKYWAHKYAKEGRKLRWDGNMDLLLI